METKVLFKPQPAKGKLHLRGQIQALSGFKNHSERKGIRNSKNGILNSEDRMKKIIIFICCFLLAFAFSGVTVALAEPEIAKITVSAKSAYLTDENLNEEIFEMNADNRYPIASMVKIMTALIAFEEVDKGNVSLDEKICISHNAMSMGGSQMFLEEGLEYPMSDLLKGIIVVSANDACVAVAERVSGSEEAFVQRMNKRAEELKLKNTNFVNCTGLPAVNGYSSARDCAVMLSELLKHPKYHDYSTIWLEDYVHPDGRVTCFTNTNKLIRFYQGCDGGKTGFTNEAGFCLSATAERNGVRLISVVIGESDSKVRFEDSKKMFNYAFANYKKEVLAKSGEKIGELTVKGGKNPVPVGVTKDTGIFTRIGEDCGGKLVVEFKEGLRAPIEKGTVVGVAKAIRNGKVVDEAEIITLEAIEKETYGDAIERVMGDWSVKR